MAAKRPPKMKMTPMVCMITVCRLPMNQMSSINIISININIIITVCIINNIIDHIIIDVSSCGRLGVVIRLMKVACTCMILLVGLINWENYPVTPPTLTEADSTSMSSSLSPR